MPRRRRRRHHNPTNAIANPVDLTVTEPKRIVPARPVDWRSQQVLDTLAALPRLAAELGYRVAAHPDGQVEVLPGDPTTIIFHAGGQLHGMFVFAAHMRPKLDFQKRGNRDRAAERLWEEERFDEHLRHLPS
jgi:hypothetical protein